MKNNIYVAHLSANILRRVINNFINAQAFEKLRIVRRSCCNDISAFVFGNLHSEMTHTTCSRMNENPLAGLDVSRLNQRLPSRKGCKRHSGARRKAQSAVHGGAASCASASAASGEPCKRGAMAVTTHAGAQP